MGRITSSFDVYCGRAIKFSKNASFAYFMGRPQSKYNKNVYTLAIFGNFADIYKFWDCSFNNFMGRAQNTDNFTEISTINFLRINNFPRNFPKNFPQISCHKKIVEIFYKIYLKSKEKTYTYTYTYYVYVYIYI